MGNETDKGGQEFIYAFEKSERQVESSRPGEMLSQDTFYVGHLKGVGKLYGYCNREKHLVDSVQMHIKSVNKYGLLHRQAG